jgi:hypothetical protein
MIQKLLLLFFLAGPYMLFAQESQDIFTTENQYRTSKNPYYWKNRKPYEGYWQQDVHYKIEAEIIDSLDIIDGKRYELTYWNNSPFELKELFFHLHENAFQPGSHYHNLHENNHSKVKFGKYEEKGLGTTIDHLKVNNQAVRTELDNTILKVFLNEPLRSGDSLVVTCTFKTYWDTGGMRRRNKTYEAYGYKHFDGVHWYPIISVYDMKFGWGTDQHLDKEYYANFGTFDIALTFPQEYIVEATGNLVNTQEVMPDSLRKKLDIKNFAKKPFKEAPSVIIPREPGKTKTWIYHAENVHNFAFTADPTYRIGEHNWKGIKVITLAQEPHASRWQQSGWYTREVIRVYSEDFGMYAWPKIIIADAKDGMEYPMLTLDNGTWPQHQSLLAHEVGHMWFYGMVGSNETYRAMLDEGFTQFLTVWAMDKILGPVRDRIGNNKYIDKYIDSSNTRYENLYYPYINHVVEDYDEPLNTHSSAFNGAIRHGGNYGLVYYKAGVMLYNLRYVLGDSLFLNAMQHYFHKWKFAHPYPEDFRQAIIEYTQTDLNWFFDQWIETTKHIDYSIDKVKRKKRKGSTELEYEITFKRKGRMQMPIDFTVTTKDNQTHHYHIPNTWFVKDSVNKTVLPKWYGWDLLHPTYTTTLSFSSPVKTIDIDPTRILADADLTNNKWGRHGIRTTQFDHRVPNLIRWDKQRNFIRPDLWYNRIDGIQPGIHGEGSYLGKYSYAATLWLNTTLGHWDKGTVNYIRYMPVAFTTYAKASTHKFWRHSSVYEDISYYGGIASFKLGLDKTFRKQDQRNKRYSRLSFYAKYLYNNRMYDQYLLYPEMWGNGQYSPRMNNSSFNISYFKNYFFDKGNGEFTISARTPFINSDYNYSWINVNNLTNVNLSKFEIRSRVFAQMGFSTQYPLESVLMLSGANSEELLENKYTRAGGFVPTNWLGHGASTNHFHYSGGLNLRGYSGYQAPEQYKPSAQDSTFMGYYSNSGASWNLEIDFDKFVKITPKGLAKNLKLDTYLFSDMGVLVYQHSKDTYFPGSFRMNAGIGTAFTIKFSPYQISPLTVRFDMPLFLNTPPPGQEYFQFRYVIGINRAF